MTINTFKPIFSPTFRLKDTTSLLITIFLLTLVFNPLPLQAKGKDCHYDRNGDRYCFTPKKNKHKHKRKHKRSHSHYYYVPQPIMPNNNYGFGCYFSWQCR